MLRDAGLGLVAYYYFDFRDTAKQDVRGLLSSLVAQLSSKSGQKQDIMDYIGSAVQSDRKKRKWRATDR